MPILGASASGAKSSPVAPTIGTATNVGTSRAYNNGSATVTFTAPNSKLPITSYTVTSSPGSYTGTGASSPLTVTGLQSATAYTFTVTATSAAGTSSASSASNSITATTVPQAPTIGTATNASGQSYSGSASISVPFTAGATGGAAVSTYTVTSSSSATGSGASSPVSVSETVGNPTSTARTYTVTATNANGISTASSASNSIAAASVPQSPTIGTVTVTNTTTVSIPFTAGATGGAAISSYTITSSPSIALSYSGTTSPFTVTGSFASNQAYTFSMTATNAQGASGSSSASNSVTPVRVYAIGDTGPGGGKVFYDAGSTLSWGRYLEAASSSTGSWNSASTYGWAPFATLVGTSSAIGTGLANSNAAYSLSSESYFAIGACRAYNGGGKSDWFLPSKDELNALSAQITAAGGATGDFYWSSTEVNATNAWYQNLNTGGQYSYVKTYSYYVRPVRAF